MTAAVTGIATAWLSLGIMGAFVDNSELVRALTRPLAACLVWSSAVKLVFDALILCHLAEFRHAPLKRSALLLNHRELYGLPRKFNISFDGGGAIATLEDTYDIGFQAVRVSATLATADLLAGIYFRLSLGGITGHRDFARDTGVLLAPNECVQVAHAVLQVFIEQGDQTDRQKARLNSACLILMAGLIVWSAPKTDPRGAAAVVGR